MEKTSTNAPKWILIYATHLVTNIFIQASVSAMHDEYLIGYSNRISDLFEYTITGIFFLIVDYIIIGVVLHKTNSVLKTKQRFHLPDLVLAIPYVWSTFKELFQIIAGTAHIKILEDRISVDIITLVIDALLVVERVLLIKKKQLKLFE